MKKHLYIITGASRGMGLAMAEQLLAQGYRVLCISRNKNSALMTNAKQQGYCLEQWTLDLFDTQHAAECLKLWLSSLDQNVFASITLINNAGVIPTIAPLSASNCNELACALRVGLEAPMLLTAVFLKATESMSIPRKVLNISSGLGRRPMASQSAYCAAKAGLDHFTRCLALDEARLPNGARVCSLAPGVIDTDMQNQLRSTDASNFPDQGSFVQLKLNGNLSSAQAAAARVLAWLQRPDFGNQPVADVRE
jgi:NAD(P)-dependent dehydrogenase (short-subunit alcohol dehydrogenase family)